MNPEHDHTSDHATQAERFPEALSPGSAPLDSRSLAALIAFAPELAPLVTYYDKTNAPASDWSAFFRYDISVLLAQIVTTDTQQDHFASLRLARASRQGEDKTQELLEAIYAVAKRVDTWYKRVAPAPSASEASVEINLKKKLTESITDDLGQHITRLRKDDRWRRIEYADRVEYGYALDPIWEVPSTGQAAESITDEELIAIFDAFNNSSFELVKLAGQYLEEALRQKEDHNPHTALYLAFVHLLEGAQEHLNKLTEKYLDYYHRDILRLEQKKDVPDTAPVCFQLAPHVEQYELTAGTLLSAGKDAAGQDLLYRTEEDVVLNQAHVAALKTLYVHHKPPPEATGVVTRIFAFPVANSEDGLGLPLVHPDEGWPTFGKDVYYSDPEGSQALWANLGLVVASPMLLLREGRRRVRLTFTFDQDPLTTYERRLLEVFEADVDDPAPLLADLFLLYLSGEEGWIPVPDFQLVHPQDDKRSLALSFELQATDPAVVENRPDVLAENFETRWPLCKIVLNPQARLYAYSFLKGLVIEEAAVEVQVDGLTRLYLQNENGQIDAGKPFQPFGQAPIQGSYLLLGNQELFQKELDWLELTIDWHNLPRAQGEAQNGQTSTQSFEEDFATYYAAYKLGITNESFRGSFSTRAGLSWIPSQPDRPAFTLYQQDEGGRLLPRSVLAFDLNEANRHLDYHLEEPLVFENKTLSGFFRIELTAPPYAFGHEIYSRLFADVVTSNALKTSTNQANAAQQSDKGKGKGKGKDKDQQAEEIPLEPVPNTPFVPGVKGVSVAYRAARPLRVAGQDARASSDAVDQFFHIYPFGQLAQHAGKNTLFPVYEAEGYLLLGLEGLQPPQSLTLLFHLRAQSTDQRCVANAAEAGAAGSPIAWHYLCDNRWKAFVEEAVISDTTRGFTRSGIVKLEIPREATRHNTILPSGMHWIRAAARTDTRSLAHTIGVYTQAVAATRVVNEAAAPPYGILPAETIGEPVDKVAAIKQVYQPFASWGARQAEDLPAYRARVSERLQHKQRAVSCWDVERLVLEAFPSIRQVKCFGAGAGPPRTTAVPPGEMLVVVVPTWQAGTMVGEPKVDEHTLLDIAAYLQQYASPFVHKICVRNPAYEYLKLTARVKFSRGKEGGLYLKRLNEDVARYLAPWRYDPEREIDLGGGGVREHSLRAYLEKRAYVEYVAGFSIVHLFKQGTRYGLHDSARLFMQDALIEPSTPWSVLVPVARHPFRILDEVAYQDVVHDRSKQWPERAGTGNLAIGTDYIVTTESAASPPSYTPRLAGTEETQKRFFLIFESDLVSKSAEAKG